MTPIISLNAITFTYAIGTSPALQNITLDVPAGQICGIIGRAGAGKSTLCALCAGFIPNFYQGQFAGQARIDGQNVVEKSVAELVSHVGLVGSNAFSQISGARFTVYEEIGFGLENIGVPRAEMLERIEWALQAMRLSELRDRSPYALSGGQQQRLVLAAILAMRPPVLVLDEPTAQLDPPTIAYLADLLRELARQGTTILFAEHRLEWTATLAERILVLDNGILIDDGPPERVLVNPTLRERGIGWPRAALIAERARMQSLWPIERPLPISLPALVAGLSEQIHTTNGHPVVRASSSASALSTAASADQEPLVAIENIRFSYPNGVHVLHGVSLTIKPGERIALLGQNGAGKSTLLRHLNGLLQPTEGQVLVKGKDTRKTTVAHNARYVGIVFQDVRNQLFARTVRDELRFGPHNLGYPSAIVNQLVDHAMEVFGLTAYADTHPYDLPPALRRLVAVAAVLAMDSDVLILDEPTAGLDAPSVDLLTTLAHTQAARGKTLIVVTHDLDFAFEALDRVILLQAGRITLDRHWNLLNAQERALLAEDVGLPLTLEAAAALSLSPESQLATLLETNG